MQSGSSEILEKMNRGYSREWYLNRIEAINRIIPNCSISTDLIIGFCGETDEDHQATLSLLDEVKFTFAYMYTYSERPKTLAERKYKDDIPETLKSSRLVEVIDKQRANSLQNNLDQIGKLSKVLVEVYSKK